MLETYSAASEDAQKEVSSSQSTPTPEATPLNVEEHERLGEARSAIGELFDLSQSREPFSRGDILRLVSTVERSLGLLQRGVTLTEGDSFFANLESVTQLTQLSGSFDTHRDGFSDERLTEVSKAGLLLIGDGLASVSEQTLLGMNQDDVVSLYRACSEVIMEDAPVPVIEDLVAFKDRWSPVLSKLSDQQGGGLLKDIVLDIEQYQGSLRYRRLVASGIDESRSRVADGIIFEGRGLIANILERYGLDAESMIAAWETQKSGFEDDYPVEDAICALDLLEVSRNGSARVLQQEFGIHHFERYPAGLLISQYDQRDADLPYGIILNPQSDHNGGFRGDYSIWWNIYLQARSGGYGIRVVECDGKQSFNDARSMLRQRYGQHRGISFAFLGGHGSEGSILLGSEGSAGCIETADLLPGGVFSDLKKDFEPNPIFVMNSCCTAVNTERGIGKVLSDQVGARLVGPKVPSYFSHEPGAVGITFSPEHQPWIHVGYVDASKGASRRAGKRGFKDSTSGVEGAFINGQEV